MVVAILFATSFQGLKSYYINQWLGKSSINGLMYALKSENRYFTHSYFQAKNTESIGSILFSLATDIRVNDIRTMMGKEIPGMSKYYSDILVAGENTDYTNIPEESSVPLEEILKNRDVAIEEVEKAKQNNSAQSKKSQKVGMRAVFIYHTHSWESFLPLLPGTSLPNEASSTNQKVNVSIVGEKLKQQLETNGIPVKHDQTNMGEFLSKRGWNWNDSYKGSREVLKEALAQQNDIAFPIDIHRDDQRKNATTKVINGKSYARLYFILGRENPQFEKNKEITTAINSYLEQHYYGISRGIFPKDRKKGDGKYNQDLSPNAMLIEVGGVDNTLEELYNTVDVLAEALSQYYWQDTKEVNGQRSI